MLKHRHNYLLMAFFMLGSLSSNAVELVPWADGFEQITDIKFLNSGKQVLVAEKTGDLYLLDLKTKQRNRLKQFAVNTSSEMGLLGILPWNDSLFVYYSPKGKSETRLSRFDWIKTSGKQTQITNEQTLLTIVQPFSNHNGGSLINGPEGSLLLSVGDGGAAGDPNNNGQNPKTLLGSIVRIIPDKQVSKGYRIPKGNLHQWLPQAQPEILAMGLRNAWKMSMSNHGDLWIADVGQNAIEEINVIDAGSIGTRPLNLGWRILEGPSCYKEANCQPSNYWLPVSSYRHEQYGQSITGGFLYEGTKVDELRDKYLFADFVSGFIGVISPPDYLKIEPIKTAVEGNWSTFARDMEGEIYIADFSGKIYKIQ